MFFFKALIAEVAQLVEHRTENPGVRGSIPRLGIIILCRRSSMVEQLIRNQQVVGSNPIVGSTEMDEIH